MNETHITALNDAAGELARAIDAFPPMRSAHEGYAIILEELDELWEQVRLHQSKRNAGDMRKEAIQVAAMALRFAVDVDPTA